MASGILPERIFIFQRFLQHVLPTGFMKIRYYDFLHPSSSISLALVRRILKEICDVEFIEFESETKPEILYPDCRGKLKYYIDLNKITAKLC